MRNLIMALEIIKLIYTLIMLGSTSLANNIQTTSTTATATATTSLPNKTSEARSKVLEFNDMSGPQEQRLALQIVITEPASAPSSSSKKKGDSKRPPASILLARKRPYDFHEPSSAHTSSAATGGAASVIEKYSPLAKHFYVLEPSTAKAPPKMTHQYNDSPKQQQQRQQSQSSSRPPPMTTSSGGSWPKASQLNQRSKLVRTQHRPPWLPRFSMMDQQSEMEVRKYFLKVKTTLAPAAITPTTTEFYKLISSAHSPIKQHTKQHDGAATNGADSNSMGGGPSDESQLDGRRGGGGATYQSFNHPSISGPYAAGSSGTTATTSTSTTTLAPTKEPHWTKSHHPTPGSVLSQAAIVFSADDDGGGGDDEHNTSGQAQSDSSVTFAATAAAAAMPGAVLVSKAGGANQQVSSSSTGGGGESAEPTPAMATDLNDRREIHHYHHHHHHHRNHSSTSAAAAAAAAAAAVASQNELPPPPSNGKKVVTLVRHKARPTRASSTTQSPVLSVPSKISLHELNPINANDILNPQSSVRLISKQRHKYEDRVQSPTLTVVDNDAFRLPPNATSVHNNKIVVAMRPGRPNRRHPSTTQFPVYNIVAGITPPYANNPSQAQFTRPPSNDGSIYGLLRPTGADATTTTHSPSTFGAPNIKFPAPAPSSLQASEQQHSVAHSTIDRLNITVPGSANSVVGPNGGVPEKILMETEEQHSRPPSDAIVVSNSTIVSRPYGSNTVNQDGIMRLSTTRRPMRFSTTKRINIVSANTTVVATNADQLHDVLSNFITGSHQQDNIHHTSQRPPERPGFFASLGSILNASVTTSVVAILTLIKTIFVAILVMFLPPIALTAAIMQAVNMG